MPDAPALTGRVVPCTQPDAPAQRGRQARDVARAAIERYPFAAHEGMRALALLAEARRCFEDANERAAATEVVALHDGLRARLDGDYRALRIRLSRALSAERSGQALRSTRRLLALLHGSDGAYAGYLRDLEHRLSQRTGAEEE